VTLAQVAATGTHPGLSVVGGTLNGIPVVPTSGAGANLVRADARAIVYGDGGVVLDISTEAAIEMADNPAAPTAATVPTSLWQLNLAGLKAEVLRNWSAALGSVQWLTVA